MIRKLFSLMMALCLLCTAWTLAGAEAVGQEVTAGRTTFTLPAELTIDEVNPSTIGATGAEYNMVIITQDWSTTDYDISSLTTGGIQFDNLFAMLLLYLTNGDSDLAIAITNNALEMETDTPDGNPVMVLLSNDAMNLVSYCIDNVGVLIVTINAEGASPEVLLPLINTVNSIRLDGRTAEEMKAYGEELAARAAELAAMQKYVKIVNDTAKVRAQADISSDLIKTVNKGDVFPMNGEAGDFYIIEIDGRTGYVHKTTCTVQ